MVFLDTILVSRSADLSYLVSLPFKVFCICYVSSVFVVNSAHH